MSDTQQNMEKFYEAAAPIIPAFQLVRALFWRSLKKLGIMRPYETLEDQSKDRILPFNEYPSCELCGNELVTEKLIARDGSRIVECTNCGLWFTSPRINEQLWIDYLKSITDRSKEFTENRLKYGVAMTANIKYTLPNWRKRIAKLNTAILNEAAQYFGGQIHTLHDVGCGVGFLLQDAQARGIKASGNELNGYAYQVMKKRFGLTVYNDTLPNLSIDTNSIDTIIFRDYIEHTYHPFEDLKAAYTFLKRKGVVFIETFHIHCRAFDNFRESWNFLFWNHVYHFSESTLTNMVADAGFEILTIQCSYTDPIIKIIARK